MGIGGFGMWEMILVFMVVLLLFGAKRLPEIGSALGKGIREFKSSVREIEGELKAGVEDTRTVPPPKTETKSDESDDGEPIRLTPDDEQPA